MRNGYDASMPSTVADLIRIDHRKFERLFAELKDSTKRSLTGPAAVALIAAHARAEESEVYPVIRERTDAASKVEHSQEEHAEADELAARLVDMGVDDPGYDEVLDRLVKSVTHHIEEEEETVLPALDQLPSDEQERLATAFKRVRAEHLTAGSAELTRSELQQQAENEGISGASSMSTEELKRQVRED